MTIAAVIGLIIWVAVLVELSMNSRKFRELANTGEPRNGDPSLPPVSLIVVAHNEERNVGKALDSLLALEYPHYEIIFVNDRSDDQTGAIVESITAEDSRVRLLQIDHLPSGWLGKNHASWRGAKMAASEILLFLDGDIILDPKVLAFSVRHLLRNNVDYLAVLPNMSASGVLLRALITVMVLFGALFSRPWKTSDPKSKSHFGVGAYGMFRLSAYRQIGGHKSVALRPDEDYRLSQLVKKNGLQANLVRSSSLLNVEWYPTITDLVKGTEKNLFAFADYQISKVVLVTLVVVFLIWVPLLMAPLLFGLNLIVPASIWMFIVFLYLALCCRIALDLHYPRWCGLLSPLLSAVLVFIVWRSTFVTIFKGVAWGGPPIPLSELRRNRIE